MFQVFISVPLLPPYGLESTEPVGERFQQKSKVCWDIKKDWREYGKSCLGRQSMVLATSDRCLFNCKDQRFELAPVFQRFRSRPQCLCGLCERRHASHFSVSPVSSSRPLPSAFNLSPVHCIVFTHLFRSFFPKTVAFRYTCSLGNCNP